MSGGDIADDMEILAARLRKEWVAGLLRADVLSIESILRHAARELRAGSLDSSKTIGQRIGKAAIKEARRGGR